MKRPLFDSRERVIIVFYYKKPEFFGRWNKPRVVVRYEFVKAKQLFGKEIKETKFYKLIEWVALKLN